MGRGRQRLRRRRPGDGSAPRWQGVRSGRERQSLVSLMATRRDVGHRLHHRPSS